MLEKLEEIPQYAAYQAAKAEAAAKEEKAQLGPMLQDMALIDPEKIDWLWPGRIALGKLTLLVGDPTLGKSLITLDIAARVSGGLSWPDGKVIDKNGYVIILSAEDDPADTIRPRLDAAGAIVSKIFLLEAIRESAGGDGQIGHIRAINLGADITHIDEAINRVTQVRLIIIDPISAYLGGIDSHNNTETRAVLAPLAQLAAKRHVAILGISHFNKGSGAAIYRTQGSIAFTAAARAVWGVMKDGEDEKEARKLMLPVKNNLAPDKGGLAYTIEAAGDTPVIHWEDQPVKMDITNAMGPEDESGAKEEAKQWIIGHLSSKTLPAIEILVEAKKAGISEKTLRRAKKELHIKAAKIGDNGTWSWHFPIEGGQGGQGGQGCQAGNLDRLDRLDTSEEDFGTSEDDSEQELDIF
ncbi:hypothetical protein ES703_86517 [subsurface metagenome]